MIRYMPWLGAMMGCVYFFLVYGVSILDPEFIQWTMKGDAATHFLGWHFFRSEPWSLPLGIIRSYQYPEGTSIVYTDSIPLLAILFKLLSPVLPEIFQYHGIWLLLVYMLQGFFAVLLLSQISKNPWVVVLGSVFFLMNPVLPHRSGGHESLTAHWLILVALYLYLQQHSLRNQLLWGVIAVFSVLIHFYILFMILMIWAGYLLKVYLDANTANARELGLFVAAVLLTTLFTMWLVGYFIIESKNSASGGFGDLSMNLLAPINPVPNNWFTFLKPVPLAVKGQYEGINYFGFGLLLLVVTAIYESIRHRHYFSINKELPLLLVCVVLSVLSVSNKVTFSNQVLFEVPLTDTLYAIFGILRASGRLFWPVSYCIMLTAMVVISRSCSPKHCIMVLSILVIVQIIDFIPLFRNFSLDKSSWKSPLVSHHWNSLAEQYPHLVMVPANRHGDEYVPFSLLAANHGMTINVGYTARFDKVARKTYQKKLMQSVQKGILEPGSLYVIRDRRLSNIATTNTQIDFIILDGFSIAAYGLKESVPQLFSLY